MGTNLTREDLEDIQNSLINLYRVSPSIPIFLTIGTFLMSTWSSIKRQVTKYVFYTPGVAEPRCFRDNNGNRFCHLATSVGEVRVPCIKSHSFDLEYGFIHTKLEEGEGFYQLDQIKEKYPILKHEKLMNVGLQMLIPISKKSQIGGDNLYFYIMDELDNFLYVHPIENEEIDYKKIFDTYEDSLGGDGDYFFREKRRITVENDFL